MLVPVSNSTNILELEEEEEERMFFKLFTVDNISSNGRVMVRSTSSGEEEGYGTCTINPGKEVSGNISNGNLTMEIIPMVINISMTTMIVTGRFNENSGKFIVISFPIAFGDQGLFLKKPPLDPAKIFYYKSCF